MPDPSPSTLTVLNSYFLQLERRSGGRPQRAVYPRRLPINTVIHTTLVGLEPTTFRLLVRRATSSATHRLSQAKMTFHLYFCLCMGCRIHRRSVESSHGWRTGSTPAHGRRLADNKGQLAKPRNLQHINDYAIVTMIVLLNVCVACTGWKLPFRVLYSDCRP